MSKRVTIDQVNKLLLTARALIKHRKFVIAGSLAVLPNEKVPKGMVTSVDVDLYPMDDPARAEELMEALGPDSTFFKENGVYADAITPALLTLPKGWQKRLVEVYHEGIVGYYVDPNDMAIAKLTRGNDNDLNWVEIGLAGEVLNFQVISQRMNETNFLDQKEHEKVKRSLELTVINSQLKNKNVPKISR